MSIKGMSHPKPLIETIKICLTNLISKPVIDNEMNKHHSFLRVNPLNGTTHIHRCLRNQIFSRTMSHHLFCCCIMLNMSMPMRISTHSSMVPSLIVITFSMKPELASTISNPFVVVLKILPSLYVAQVVRKIIAAASNHQINYITT